MSCTARSILLQASVQRSMITLFLCSMMIFSCAGSHRQPSRQEGEQRRITEIETDASRAYLERRTTRAILSGEGKLRIRSDNGRKRVSFLFTYQRPDRLRIQFNSPMGPAVGLLDFDGNSYLFADFRNGCYLEGNGGREVLEGLFGLPLDPGTLTALLLAEPRADGKAVIAVWTETETGRPVRCLVAADTVDAGEHLEASYRWEDQDSAGGFPCELELTGGHTGWRLMVRYLQVLTVDQNDPSSIFHPVDLESLKPLDLEDLEVESLSVWAESGPR